MDKFFSVSNRNFWASLVIFALSMMTALGIKFPDTPTAIGNEVVTSITTLGFYSVIGILITSVIMPIWNFVKAKPEIKIIDFLSSANTWMYIAAFIVSVMIVVGIKIPEGTGEAIVVAITSKDWGGLVAILIGSVLNPIIRWLKEKRQQALVKVGYVAPNAKGLGRPRCYPNR